MGGPGSGLGGCSQGLAAGRGQRSPGWDSSGSHWTPRTIPYQTPRSSPTPPLSGAQIISVAPASDRRATWHLKGFLRVSLADRGQTANISLSLMK